MKSVKSFVAGFMVAVLLCTGVVLAGAAVVSHTLDVFSARIVVNGVDKTQKDNQFFNGVSNVPSSLVGNGTTYVPLRLFANMLGVQVDYAPKTQTIYIGGIPEDDRVYTPMTSLFTEPYYADGCDIIAGRELVVGGKIYSDNTYVCTGDHSVYTTRGVVKYNLEAKYISIKGKLGLTDDINNEDTTFEVYGDGNLLASYLLEAGSLPQDFLVDVTNVTELEYRWSGGGQTCLLETYIK